VSTPRPANGPQPVRVVTVDDHVAFLRAAEEVIRATPGFDVAGEATSGQAALAIADEAKPDLMLIDVHMPGMDGIEVASRLTELHADTTIVLISAQDLSQIPAAAGRCGAAAVVRKEDVGPRLLRRLWQAHGCGPRARVS